MTYTIQGGSVQTRQVKLTTTAPTVLLDAQQSGATVIAIYAAAISGTPNLTLEKFDGTTSYYLRYQRPMAANEEFERESIIVLKVGEQIRATASAANAIDVMISYIPGDRTALGRN